MRHHQPPKQKQSVSDCELAFLCSSFYTAPNKLSRCSAKHTHTVAVNVVNEWPEWLLAEFLFRAQWNAQRLN